MIDDHDMCEWVNVSSGRLTRVVSDEIYRAVKRLCVYVLLGIIKMYFVMRSKWLFRRTHTHTQQFYGSKDFVRDNPGEPVPEETFTQKKFSKM